ncbi:hypothetical protein HELRODRAFT_162488 [Helobdella robusta]|uniref:Major facilitator superfamily (MFS) profile domain-containing protein n=1 Tax=Helobdella robusta TaxID=6412 RepID=T1ESQ7_HELRO|nr:hypothetical protein HELRODRAFT_162488 [Helobdella robusta]ESN99011.1 hypothetical protein HELRODRAFT_162488 [Helobdella robusta]
MEQEAEFAIHEIKPPGTSTKIINNIITLATSRQGFVSVIPGLTFDHWKEKFDLNIESYSRVWMIDGAGIFAGALMCAIIPCCCSHLCFGVGAIFMSLFPCTANFVCFQISSFVSGFGKGMIIVCGLKLLHLWPESSASVVIQLFFISYSIGGMLAVQLSQYYLTSFISLENVGNTTFEDFIHSISFNDSSAHSRGASADGGTEVYFIQILIFIICCLSFVFMSFWSCFCNDSTKTENSCSESCLDSKKKQKESSGLSYEDFHRVNRSVELSLKRGETWSDQREVTNDAINGGEKTRRLSVKQWFSNNNILDAAVLMFLYVHFFFAFGLESILAKFLCHINTIFSTQKLQYTIDNYSVYSIFTCMFVVGRFLSISFLHAYASNAIIAVCLATNVVASAIISAYFDKSENMVLFCLAAFSAFLSPILPAGFSRVNSYLAKSFRSLGLAVCCAGIGYASFSWICGFILSRTTPFYLMFFITATCCLCTLMYVPLLVRVKRHRDSYRNANVIATTNSRSIVTYV